MSRGKIEKFAGCLLGGAVGDALGAPIEFSSLADIRGRFGPAGVRGYVSAAKNSRQEIGPKGRITDDTQMTMFTAEGLIRAYARWATRGICSPPAVVFHAYIRWLHTQGLHSESSSFDKKDDGWLINVNGLHSQRAPGSTCLSALQRGRAVKTSKGCGGVMRAAPVGLFYDATEAFEMGCEVAATTHGHPSGYLAAGYLAAVIANIIAGESVRAAIDSALPFLLAARRHKECLCAINAAVQLAEDRSVRPSPETVERLGEGWVAEEALAISLYCALVARANFRRGLLLAVNHSGDSDSTGAITGNILGAHLGKAKIPASWLKERVARGNRAAG
jgi:ADP-ribosylglycohydrolase